MEKYLKEVQDIARIVFNKSDLEIGLDSSAKSVYGWDSLTNLIFIDAIEKAFNVKFSLDEIMNASNVGDLIRYITQKNNSAL